jgi:gas vesicle protein
MAERNGVSLLSFLAGTALGVVIGLLIAPRPGKETREVLKEKAREYLEEGQKVYETSRERVSKAMESGKEVISEKAEALKEKVGEAKEKIQEKAKSLRGSEEVEEVKPEKA